MKKLLFYFLLFSVHLSFGQGTPFMRFDSAMRAQLAGTGWGLSEINVRMVDKNRWNLVTQKLDTSATLSANKITSGVLNIARLPTTSGGFSSTQVVRADDPRLINARTPTAHTHPVSDISATGTPDGTKYLAGDGSWKVPPGGGVVDPGGNGYMVRTSNNTTVPRSINVGTGLSVTNPDGVAGNTTISIGYLPATQINVGTLDIARLPVASPGESSTATVPRSDDPRMSNARTPTSHTHPISEISATGTPDGTKFLSGDGTWKVPSSGGGGVADPGANGIMVRTSTNTTVPRSISAGTGGITVTNGNGASGNPTIGLGNIDASQVATGTLAIGQIPVVSSGVNSPTGVVRGDDSRLNNARTPTSHTHPITDISATGTPDGTKFLAGDGTWKTPTTYGVGNTKREYYEQVLYAQNMLGNGAGPLLVANSGSGAGLTFITDVPIGYLGVSAGTSTSGSAFYGTSASFFSANSTVKIAIEAVIVMPFFTDGTNTFQALFGFTKSTGNAGNYVGWNIQSSAFQGRSVISSSTQGTAFNGASATAGNSYRLRVEFDGTTAKYYMKAESSLLNNTDDWPWALDGSDVVGTYTNGVGGISYPSPPLAAGALISKSAGTGERQIGIRQLVISKVN